MQGVQGIPGTNGKDCNIQIGNTQTLPPGSDATATTDKDEEQNILYLNLGIPKGEKGDKGDTGDTNFATFDIVDGKLIGYPEEQGEEPVVLGTVAMEPKGNYDADTYYEKLNLVLYNGATYIAKEPVQGEAPVDSDKWQIIGTGVTADDIIDNLNSNDATKMLSAKQGKVLNSTKPYYFDTVALMKVATLSNGDYVITKGYYSANDGGGADYMIRTKGESEVANETTKIALSDNTLIAELILNENYINPKKFGAYCDGTHDDSDALEACLNFTANLSSSNGTWKRTILIPAIIKVTRRIDCATDQFKMLGTSLNNSRIVFNGSTSYLNFAKSDNSRMYEIEIENVKFYGDYSQTDSILKFTNGNNIYLRRVETCNGGLNQYNISFIDTGIIFMDECTVVGSNDVENYPGNRNGIYVNSMGSILNFTNANCWNLNNMFKFEGTFQNINIESNWIECIKSLLEIKCVTDMRYMNIKIKNNTINTHAQSSAFYPTTFNFVSFDMANSTNFFGSNLNIDNNTIYFQDVTAINGNSLIYFNDIGDSASSTFTFNFNNNIFSGLTLNDLQAYVFYNSNNSFYNQYNVKFKSFTGNTSIETGRITDKKQIIKCIITEKALDNVTAPNGIYLAKDAQNNYGNIYYENGAFYAGYAGTIKSLPEKVNTNIPYATDTSDVVSVVNTIIDTLYQAHITNIHS